MYGFNDPTIAGDSHLFIVEALDAGNNRATSYLGTVHFTSSDPLATLPANYTFTVGNAGIKSFSAMLATAGVQSITATDTLNSSITGTQTDPLVLPGPISTIVIAPSSATINAGSTQAYTAQGFDAYGNSLGDVTSATTFTIGAPGSCVAANCGSSTAGGYTVTGTDGAASNTASLTVSKQNQTVVFTSSAPAGATVGGPTYSPTASASSGLAVALTIDATSSTVCSISAGVVSFIGAGTCRINANQAGNGTYNAAPQVQQIFTVAASAVVSVTSVNPNTLGRGATNAVIAINGTGFVSGATVSISGSGDTVNSVTFVSSTLLNATVTISSGATLSSRNVTVDNPGPGGVATCSNCLTIASAPSISSLSPNDRGQGAVNQNILITGSNFGAGTWTSSSVWFSGTGITVNSVTRTNSTHLTVNVSISSSAATGSRSVTVRNPNLGQVTDSGAFTVNAKPTISSLSPSSRARGQSNQNIVITGSGFLSGSWSTSRVVFSGTGITVISVTRTNSTHLTVRISVSASATLGARTVTVTNLDGGVGSKASAFTVTP